jgi:hypothetical protein
MTKLDQLKWRAAGLAVSIPVWVYLGIRTDSWIYYVVAVFVALTSTKLFAQVKELRSGKNRASFSSP